MSRFFPHPSFAEDQPLAHTILTTHVIARTVTAGTIVAAGITTTRNIIPALRPKLPSPFVAQLLRSVSTGSVIGFALGALMTAGRMQGRDLIEWQDRSWRLLANQGQVETDDWTLAGMLVGAVAGGSVAAKNTLAGWRGFVGGMGLGSVGGMLGYLAYRYGMRGGKFPEIKV